MATKSFTNEQNFTKKATIELLKTFERTNRKSVKLTPPANTAYVKKNTDQLSNFIKGLKID